MFRVLVLGESSYLFVLVFLFCKEIEVGGKAIFLGLAVTVGVDSEFRDLYRKFYSVLLFFLFRLFVFGFFFIYNFSYMEKSLGG